MHVWIRTENEGIHFSPLATMVLSIVETPGHSLDGRMGFKDTFLVNGMKVQKSQYDRLFEKIEEREHVPTL